MALPNNCVTKTHILRIPDVQRRVGLSRAQIYSLVTRGEFPAPIKLGVKASGWLESEIDHWIDEQIKKSRRAVGEEG